MKKKVLCLFLVLVCVLSLSLTGCGKPDSAADSTGGTTTAPATQPTTQPTTVPTTAAPTEPTPPEFDPKGNKTWAEDGVLKILTIGNSFSNDVMPYVYDIAYAAGAKSVYLGNLYIGSCDIDKHLKNASADTAAYTYYTNEVGTFDKVSKYKLSDAVKSQNWDFISFQQSSKNSGLPEKYSGLKALVSIVKSQCTNPKVEFIWHMTWAYQNDYTGSAFTPYQIDQMTMYKAIVNSVKTQVFPLEDITRVVPNGTVMQNIRSSYWGDTITRDGLHLSLPYGRILGGITMVAATIGIDYDKIDLSELHEDEKFIQVALESVKNAMESPYEVTQSKITK